MAIQAPNPLLSSNQSSDSRFQVQLHPLVILTISDYVTRHTLRRQKGPIVGAILGAQNGHHLTMEHAFECKVELNGQGEVRIDPGWFHDRLQQFKDVQKAPALDLVGWFTLAPPSGPQPHHVTIHQFLLETYSESALLLAFHPSSVVNGTSKGSKLPITIYETIYEAGADDGDKRMQSSDEVRPQLVLKFKELPYSIETGEAEMIGVDFVARGSANATMNNGTTALPVIADTKGKGKGKGKGKATEAKNDGAGAGLDLDILPPEDEELISTLTAKANAIEMLQQRITLMKSYLDSLPQSYLNVPPSAEEPVPTTPHAQISHPILRSISAILARLPLLTPTPETSTPSEFAREAARQRSDVALVGLLGSLGSTFRAAERMGHKAFIVERARSNNKQMAPGGPMHSAPADYGLSSYSSYSMDQDSSFDMEAGNGSGPMSGFGDGGLTDDETFFDGNDDEMEDGGGVNTVQRERIREARGMSRSQEDALGTLKKEEDEEMT